MQVGRSRQVSETSTAAARVADRGYHIVHGKIAFEGGSADELNNKELFANSTWGSKEANLSQA